MSYKTLLNAYYQAQVAMDAAIQNRKSVQQQLVGARLVEKTALDALNSIPGAPVIVPDASVPATGTVVGAVMTATGGCGTVFLGPMIKPQMSDAIMISENAQIA